MILVIIPIFNFLIEGNWIPDLLKICNAQAVGSCLSEKSHFTRQSDINFTEIGAIIFMHCRFNMKTTIKELELKNYDDLKKNCK